ncbi:PLP-dependent aminotransferase family protein [Campylobacter geochelonis]|uniref:HTH-type transcriptional regulatory protein gabR n=1 Tax=Campylobacter geochelonis TaxID=1780362 RepID=A0A128ECX7_9BACT|nr:PLP-dependent aminotransferase family protein [Campylobacter geochelonis]QKF72054.1 PLP-dependent aminotransferase [Campylobacter geochelonis]CZE46826.1 HTH-type transcriptional regulatory protein gabR [Campylobacter geochelonis]
MFLNLKEDGGYLYLQIYQEIKNLITKNTLKKDSKLPSIRTLCKEYQISKNTVTNAYYQLEMEGFIRCENKVGFFVNSAEHLLNLKHDKKLNLSAKKEYKFDFSYGGIDKEHFPYSVWKRVFKESLSGSDLLESSDAKGYLPLREVISNYLKNSRGINANASEIIVSAGTEHLFYILKKLFNQSSVYGFEDPGYAWKTSFFTSDLLNLKALKVDKYGLDTSTLKDVDIAWITPYHQFPLGTTMSLKTRIFLLEWAKQGEKYIVEDDYDGEFKYKGRVIPALKSMDKDDKVVYLGSFSNSLTPALRLSYMVLPQELGLRYEEAFLGFVSPCSVFVQKALKKFIEDGYFEKHINRMRNIYAQKHALIKQSLEKSEKITLYPSQIGTSVAFKAKTDSDFLKRCEEASMRLGSVNECRQNRLEEDDEFILGFAKPTLDELKEGLGILKKLI